MTTYGGGGFTQLLALKKEETKAIFNDLKVGIFGRFAPLPFLATPLQGLMLCGVIQVFEVEIV